MTLAKLRYSPAQVFNALSIEITSYRRTKSKKVPESNASLTFARTDLRRTLFALFFEQTEPFSLLQNKVLNFSELLCIGYLP
jgi:hypothetical protein